MTTRSFQDQSPRIAATAYVDPTAVVIGEVTVGEDSSLWPFAVARGDVNTITLGARTNIQDATVLHVTHRGPYSGDGQALVVGDDVTVGHRVILHGCRIGNRVLIGMGAIVMDAAVIEDEVVLGAGSLVPPGKVLTGGHLWVGSPARKVRALNDEERAGLRYSAEHYVRLARRHRGQN